MILEYPELQAFESINNCKTLSRTDSAVGWQVGGGGGRVQGPAPYAPYSSYQALKVLNFDWATHGRGGAGGAEAEVSKGGVDGVKRPEAGPASAKTYGDAKV